MGRRQCRLLSWESMDLLPADMPPIFMPLTFEPLIEPCPEGSDGPKTIKPNTTAVTRMTKAWTIVAALMRVTPTSSAVDEQKYTP